MAVDYGYQGHAFNVTHAGEYTAIPKATTIYNSFDHFGMLIGLQRLPGERNADYRARLLDVYIHRGGAHQDGLINALTRELGLNRREAISISTTATNGRIIVGDTYLQLWEDDTNYTEYDIYSRSSSVYFIKDLVDAIDSNTYFSATLLPGVNGGMPSGILLPKDTMTWQALEPLKNIKRNKLLYTNIVENSVRFSTEGYKVFHELVYGIDGIVASGDYYIDYTNNMIYSYDPAPIGTVVSYYYHDFPTKLEISPVNIYEFTSTTFRSKIFEQVLNEEGLYIDGVPTSEAVDYINEIMSVRNMLWGE